MGWPPLLPSSCVILISDVTEVSLGWMINVRKYEFGPGLELVQNATHIEGQNWSWNH